jgi:hypothetical protein
MLPNIASTPLKEAELAMAIPADRAQGLINSWEAPAEPARSGLPACTVLPATSGSTIIKASFLVIVAIIFKLR